MAESRRYESPALRDLSHIPECQVGIVNFLPDLVGRKNIEDCLRRDVFPVDRKAESSLTAKQSALEGYCFYLSGYSRESFQDQRLLFSLPLFHGLQRLLRRYSCSLFDILIPPLSTLPIHPLGHFCFPRPLCFPNILSESDPFYLTLMLLRGKHCVPVQHTARFGKRLGTPT